MRSWATAAASGIILEDAAFSADAAVTRNRLVTNCESALVAHPLTASGEEFTHVVAPGTAEPPWPLSAISFLGAAPFGSPCLGAGTASGFSPP
jgi:hypothetical protein